ncbi:flagellar biosynthesis protein FliQ [candidate division KSB1 bacterium]
MTPDYVVYLAKQAVYIVLMVSGPVLGLALVVGLTVGIFQAVTSVNEMTLTFVPKIVIVIVTLVVFAPWILRIMLTFTINLFNLIPGISH